MAYTQGQIQTPDRTVGVKQDIDEAIRILTPTDVPLQQMLPSKPTNEIKVEWLEEELMPQSVTLSAVSGSDPYTCTTTDTTELRVNDILWTHDGTDSTKQWKVTSITNSTTFVVAAFPTAHATAPGSTATLDIIGQLPSEGGAPLDARSTERSTKYNYTQIVQEAVEASRTARNRGRRGGMFGVGDPYDHEVEKKFKELAIRFERALLHGQRYQSGDTRFMGGMFYFITTNSTSGVKANLRTLINTAITTGYTSGGSGNYVLMVSPTIKSLISALDDSYLLKERSDHGAGQRIDTFESDQGTVQVVANRHFPRTRGLVLEMNGDTCIANFDPYFYEVLAKTKDGDQGQIVAEKSLVVKNEKASGLFTVTDA